MNGEEHYLSKIERNANALDKVSGIVKEECLNNIKWARELSKKLDLLDYDVREEAISKIHSVLDNDYIKMGFEIDNNHKTL